MATIDFEKMGNLSDEEYGRMMDKFSTYGMLIGRSVNFFDRFIKEFSGDFRMAEHVKEATDLRNRFKWQMRHGIKSS